MNYLAHIFLSGLNDDIVFGNFIADEVKGAKYLIYNKCIQEGILLHRKIDNFTDNNEIYLTSKHRLNRIAGKFSGVVADIYYDHFLTKNWAQFSSENYEFYIKNFYSLIIIRYFILPERLKMAFPYMILNKWFIKYQSIDGIEDVFKRMAKNTIMPDYSRELRNELINNYDLYNNEFLNFFKSIIIFLKES